MQDPQTDRRELLGSLQSYISSILLGVAAKIRLADNVDPPKTTSELATILGLPESYLGRILAGIEQCEVVTRTSDGRWQSGRLGYLLKSDAPGSLIHFATRVHDVYYPAWGGLLEGMRKGITPFESVFKEPYFSYMEKRPEHSNTFNTFMTAGCALVANKIVSTYNFPESGAIADIGGGEGALLGAILSARPIITGVLLDLPSAIESAKVYLEQLGVADRCTLVAGSMFDTIPENCSIYILKHVLHNWDDEACLRILRRCRQVMNPDAKLLVLERLVPPDAPLKIDVRMDLHMFVQMGGAERSELAFRHLFNEAGLQLRTVVRGGDETITILEAGL